jgi:hypothetical protein
MHKACMQTSKETGKALAVLIALRIVSHWAGTLCSLLVVVVLLHYAAYAWQTIARIPAAELTGLLAVAGFALLLGFATNLGYGALTVTGLALVMGLPIWGASRKINHADEEHAPSRKGEPS